MYNDREITRRVLVDYKRFCSQFNSCSDCPIFGHAPLGVPHRCLKALESSDEALDIFMDWREKNPPISYLDEYCKRMDIDKTNLLFITTNVKSIIGCRKIVMEKKASPPNCAFNPCTSDECWKCWNKAYNT